MSTLGSNLFASSSPFWTRSNLTYGFSGVLPTYYSGTSSEYGVSNSFYQTSAATQAIFTKHYAANASANPSDYASYAADVIPITFTAATGAPDLDHLGYTSNDLAMMRTFYPPNYSTTEPNFEQKAGDSLIDEAKFNAQTAAYQNYTVLHEIGHSLGLNDTSTSSLSNTSYDSAKYTVMSYKPDVDNGSAWAHGYQQLDIAALQELYGANFSSRSEDTTYSFSGNPGILTIWDGGGTDTIDVSHMTDKSGTVIDLNPGAFSSIGGLNNVAVALTSHLAPADQSRPLIENVICSAYGDVVTGNDANNVIWGGAGVDSLSGGKGDDEIHGGASNDELVGGAGNDQLYGDAGDDDISGGAGNDELYGGAGNDLLKGGAGFSQFLDGGDGNDKLLGGAENTDSFNGGEGDDVIGVVGAYESVVYGGVGADTIWIKANPHAYVDFWDPDESDSVVWNGYKLTNLQAYILDQETTTDTNGHSITKTTFGWANAQGFSGTLNDSYGIDEETGESVLLESGIIITLPDSGHIVLHNWENGGAGIFLNGPDPYDVSKRDPGSDHSFGGIPKFSTANNGVAEGDNGAWMSDEALYATQHSGSISVPDFMV